MTIEQLDTRWLQAHPTIAIQFAECPFCKRPFNKMAALCPGDQFIDHDGCGQEVSYRWASIVYSVYDGPLVQGYCVLWEWPAFPYPAILGYPPAARYSEHRTQRGNTNPT